MIEKADIEKAIKIGTVKGMNKAIQESGRITNEVNDVLSRRQDSSCKFPISFTVRMSIDDKAKTVGVEAFVSANRENIKLATEPECFPMNDPNQPELPIFDNTEGQSAPDTDEGEE